MTKLCTKCLIEKPTDAFKRDKRKPSGFATICRECSVEAARAWRAANVEHTRQYGRERDARYKAIAKKKYTGEQSSNRTPRKPRTPTELAARAAYQRAWEKANRGKMIIVWRNKRARRAGAEGRYTQADIDRIERAQRGRCAYCRIKLGKRRHIDHIQSLASGGSNWPHNLQLLCVPCNTSKRARDPIDFAQTLGLLI